MPDRFAPEVLEKQLTEIVSTSAKEKRLLTGNSRSMLGTFVLESEEPTPVANSCMYTRHNKA